MSNFDPIPRLQQIAATIEESGADIFDAPATAVHYINCAIKEIEQLREEQEDTHALIERTGAILTATANALHGGYAPPDCLHSWHDLPELVEQLRKERDELRCEVCDWVGNHFKEPPQDVAKRNGWNCFDTGVWDCYKENTNG